MYLQRNKNTTKWTHTMQNMLSTELECKVARDCCIDEIVDGGEGGGNDQEEVFSYGLVILCFEDLTVSE